MKFYTVKAISPEDGVVFLEWRTKARSSQAALSAFAQLLDDCLNVAGGLHSQGNFMVKTDFEIKGDFNVEIREVERDEILKAA